MVKKIIFLILIFFAIGFLMFFANHKSKTKSTLELFGNIEIRQVDLSFQVAGKVEKLLKEEGDEVRAGELVAILDSRDYEAEYKKASAAVEQTRALSNDASSKFERQAPLTLDNTISKQDYDTLLNTRDKTKADYDAALASKTFAKNQLDYTKLYAPEDGIIMVRVQEAGATVAKGQAVYTMAKTKPVWARAYVNETDLGNIKYGQEVKVTTDTYNPETGTKREYKGQIGYISPVAEFTPKTVQSTDVRTNLVYRIRVYICDIDEFLRQGMPVTINVDLKSGASSANGKN